jgi:hypothetical protein
MKVVTLKLRSPSEWEFLSDLLRRLHISFEWKEETSTRKNDLNGSDPITALYGSWPSDKSSDELAESIRSARVNQTREISL